MKALISFAVTAKLICAFIFFAYADCLFSHEAAQILCSEKFCRVVKEGEEVSFA